jgi:hypothetical protein
MPSYFDFLQRTKKKKKSSFPSGHHFEFHRVPRPLQRICKNLPRRQWP